MADYDIGDIATLTKSFRDDEDALVDPDTVTFEVEKPDDTTLTYVFDIDEEIVRDSEGVYHVDLAIDQEGIWFYRWISTGPDEGAEEGQFEVRPSAVDGEGLAELLPKVDDVGDLLRELTTDSDSSEVGTFTENTRPTFAQVERYIRRAANDVVEAVGTDFDAAQHRSSVRSIITLGAALLVQIRIEGEIYDRYKKMYDEKLARLITAVEADGDGGVDGPAGDDFLPTGMFPDPDYSREFGAENPR